MKTKITSLNLCLHPEALYDRPYEPVCVDISDFKSLKSPFEHIKNEDEQLFAHNSASETMRIQIVSDHVVRLRISPDESAWAESVTEKLGLINTESRKADFKFETGAGSINAETPFLKLAYNRNNHNFSFQSVDGTFFLKNCSGGVRFSSAPAEWSGHRFFADFDFAQETVFGLGGRMMPPVRNGQSMDFYNVKAGRRIGDYGGFSIPFYLSSKGYGLFLNNPWPHLYFDMGKSFSDRWFINAPGGEFDVFVIYGPEFSDIMREFTRIVGRIPVPDKFIFGFWCSSLTFVNDKDVLQTVDRLHNEGYPCDVVVLDGPWRGGENFVKQYTIGQQYPSNDMNWHPDFGDGPKMIAELKKRNIKTSLHLNSRNFHPSTAANGLEKGLLRKCGDEVVVNLAEAAAVKYYESLLEPRIKEGVDIWWIDHADRVSGDIAEGLPSRNLFGSLWCRLIYDLMARCGIKNHLCLTRGSGIGGQKYALPWPGDTRIGIDAFQGDIWFSINVGLAGYPVFSVDLGGFTLSKNPDDYENEEQKIQEMFDDENICRRLCQSIFFVPTPRIHNNWDSLPKLPWKCSDRAAKLYRQMLKIRYELTPYIYSYALNAAKTGEPIIRPLVYHNRQDRNTYNISDQFYMGEWLIIAPVTEKNVTARKVYLPAGRWINIWTGQNSEGPAEITVPAPLYDPEGLPVFVKTGAVLPRQPFTLTLRNEVPSELTFDIYPCREGNHKIYESDTVVTSIEYHSNDRELIITSDNLTAIDRTYKYRIHKDQKPQKVLCNGKIIPFDFVGQVCSFKSIVKQGLKNSFMIQV